MENNSNIIDKNKVLDKENKMLKEELLNLKKK